MSRSSQIRTQAVPIAFFLISLLLATVLAAQSATPTEADFERALAALGIEASEVRVSIVYPGGDSPLDLSGDGIVNLADRRAFVLAFGSATGDPNFDARADWDGDGLVGPRDRYAFAAAYAGWKGVDLGTRYDDGHVLPVSGPYIAGALPTPNALARAVTEPAGLERFLTWAVDGEVASSGSVLSSALQTAGAHQIDVRLPGAGIADEREITAYEVAVYDPTRQRLFERDRDYVLEGIDYTFKALTEPPGFADHVRWHAETRYGMVDYGHTGGAEFDVRFAHTFGTEDRAQQLMVQADSFVIDQQVQGAGQFPASLAHNLYDAFDKLSTTVDASANEAAAGRKVLANIRDNLLPVYFEVLDFELEHLALDAFVPFRENAETEVLKAINTLLDSRTDAELTEIVYVDSELRLLPADFAFDAGLPGRIVAETDADGFLVSSSWVLKWLWNRSQAVLGCLAQGPAKIIHKLIGALHGAIHDGALDAIAAAPPTAAPAVSATTATLTKPAVTTQPTATQREASATFDELVKLSRIIVNGENAANGGRQVVRRVQNVSLPFVDLILRKALTNAGEDRMAAFLDRGMADAAAELTAVLAQNDDAISSAVYSDVSLLPAARSILAAEAGIRRLIDGIPAGTTGELEALLGKASAAGGFDVVKWLWDTIVGLIGCIPNIGALLEKLVGMAHDVAHRPPNPTISEPGLIAQAAFEKLVDTVISLENDPTRGRALALHVRDETLPAVLDVISLEVIDLGEAHLAEAASLAVAAQQNRMSLLLDRTDDQLNTGLYDNKGAVRAFAETYAEVFGIGTGIGTGDATGSGFQTRAAAGNVWNSLMRVIKCLSEGSSQSSAAAVAAGDLAVDATQPQTRADDDGKSDKLIWAIEQIHSFLH